MSKLGFVSFVRIVAGTAFILFVPGFAWTWVFYGKDRLGALERTVYSVAISIALLSVTFFFCNRFLGIGINMLSSSVIVVVLTLMAPVHMQLKARGIYGRLLPGKRKKSQHGA